MREFLEIGGTFGDYKVIRPLGRGGTGAVYLVENPVDHTLMAAKVVDPDFAGTHEDFVRRFVREAEFAMKVRHPSLVEVYDAGVDPDTGFCYMIMEYMAGGSLRSAMAAHGKPTLERALGLVADIVGALEYVHKSGLVHRDVKPDNILLTATGKAKLGDLGISRFVGQDESESLATATLAGVVVGTPAYMAPEQMIDAHKVDIRADIYSLGMVLYEMLAGRRPNAGVDPMRILAQAIDGREYPDVRKYDPSVPPALARLVTMMLSPRPEGRPPSPTVLRAYLAEPSTIPGAGAAAVAAQVCAAAPSDRGMVLALLAVICAFLALAAAFWSTYMRN